MAEAGSESGGNESSDGGEHAAKGGNKGADAMAAEEAAGGKAAVGEEVKTFEKPEYLDEKFFDTKTGEADIEGLSKSYAELGTKIREKAETTRKGILAEMESDKDASRPKTANDYELRVTDDLQAEMGDDMTFEFADSDPLINFWREMAHESGFTQEQFDEGVSTYIRAKFAEMPSFEAEIGKLGDNGRDRAQHINQWVVKNYSPETVKALQNFAVTADGVVALEEMMRNTGEPAFSPGGPAGVGSSISLNELRAMQADERYWHPQKMDPEWVKKVDAGYEKLVS
jgi:hypothetical protein